ncbi:MAG: TRAP transporter TatT component family protein [Candidatus Bipolaricaulia bacterium]
MPLATRRTVLTAAVVACLAAGSGFASDEATRNDLLALADDAYTARHVPERMTEAISLYEAVLPSLGTLSVQSQAFVLDRLAQLCYEATTFTTGDTPEDRELFELGKAYGLQSLRLDPEFADIEARSFADAVAIATDPAALLWTADNWGALCGIDLFEGLLQFGKVRALYERCLAVDETYWGASSHNALGALLVVTPSTLGGDLERGRMHLEKAITLAPSYLLNRVVYAQYWGFSYGFFGNVNGVRDNELIERELTFVLGEPIGAWPFWNREAKKEAEALLQRLREAVP